MQPSEELFQAGAVLLQNENPGELRAAAETVYTILSGIAGVVWESEEPADDAPIALPGGKAICPKEAGRCVLEYARTAMFARGVRDGLLEARRRFPGGTIHAVYAGCGPLAPLLVLPAPALDGAAVEFTLIDVHSRSLDAARKVVRALGLERMVRDYVQADAAAWRGDPAAPIHAVITETMQRALDKEPQAAITANLAPQMADGGVLIPECISVEAVLLDRGREFSYNGEPLARDRIRLGELIELSAATAQRLPPPPVTVRTPKLDGDRYSLALLTSITTFGPHRLGDYDSSITCAKILRPVPAADTPAGFTFVYDAGPRPGFRF